MSPSPPERVASRLVHLSLLAVVVETLAALLLGPPITTGERLLDVLARSGRVAALAAPFFMAAFLVVMASRRWSRIARLSDWAQRQVAQLAAPWRGVRMLVVFTLATVVCTRTLARHTQLPWRVGALYALVPLLAAAAIELALAAWRRWPAPAGPSWRGGAAFVAIFGFLVLAVLPRVDGTALLVAASFGAMAWLVPLDLARHTLARALLGGFALAALGGWTIDARQPGLRRHVGVHTPMSGVGLDLLLWATDFDRDGSSGLLGFDCDDLDPDRHPMADDLPDDGIDQNCTGEQATTPASLARYGPGGVHAPEDPGPPPSRRPDVIIVTVDAWRAADFDPALMPETWAWAQDGWRFTHARSSANYTSMAWVALMTGMEPRHAQGDWGLVIGPGNERHGELSVPPTLASALTAAGWHTMAITPILPHQPWMFTGVVAARAPMQRRLHPAEAVLPGAASVWMSAPRGRPRFLWVHLLDLHLPYLAPGGAGYSRSHYLAAARRLDTSLSAFLRELPPDAVIVLTADHGEAFGEHGAFTHQHTLFDEEVRVPLVLRLPPDLGGDARVIDTPVGLVDVMPTLLDLLGLSAPYRRHGESLLPHVLEGRPLRDPMQVMESWHKRHHLEALQDGCWKWMRDLDREWQALFDTCADPHERRDLSATNPTQLARMRAAYFEILDLDLDAFRSWR